MKLRTPLAAATATIILASGALAQEAVPAPDKELEVKAIDPKKDDPEKVADGENVLKSPSNVLELPDSVKNLTPEDRQKLQKLMYDASTYISGIRIQEAFEKIIDAEEMAPDFFQVHNLKGAAYTKIRDFKKARVCFEKALELNPKAFMTRFNLTELDFVEDKFADAEKNFKALIADSPKMNIGTRRLIEFKILISQLSQGKQSEAEAIQKTFHYMEDTPAFYFGNAAIAFHAEDENEARGWIRSAERIYSPQEVSVYVDSFIEMEWIENLQ